MASRKKSHDLRIIKLSGMDVDCKTRFLGDFRDLVISSCDMYPGIDKWVSGKVLPGLKTSERIAYVGYQGEVAVVSAVLKLSAASKFCHLRIKDDFQDLNLGEVFFALMAFEARHDAQEIHFTLPESLWEGKKEFFGSFGFRDALKAWSQYRLFDKEIRCSATFEEVWRAVLHKLPKLRTLFSIAGFPMDSDLLLSVRPKYADQILSGNKRVEIRRRFNANWTGSRVTLYSTHPQAALVGEAKVERVCTGDPVSIWNEFGSGAGCTFEEYSRYVAESGTVFAIVLSEVTPFPCTIPLSQLTTLIQCDLTPPQSYCRLKGNEDWSRAVSVAALLQSAFSRKGLIEQTV